MQSLFIFVLRERNRRQKGASYFLAYFTKKETFDFVERETLHWFPFHPKLIHFGLSFIAIVYNICNSCSFLNSLLLIEMIGCGVRGTKIA